MELWIRSQDKMKLVLVKNVTVSVMNDSTWLQYEDYDGTFKLGEYETKERALEVLDEIQRLIEDLQYISYAIENEKFCAYRPNVYNMPEK